MAVTVTLVTPYHVMMQIRKCNAFSIVYLRMSDISVDLLKFLVKRVLILLHLHEIVEELYFYFSLSVCLSVCVCVCVCVSVNKIPDERMHRF